MSVAEGVGIDLTQVILNNSIIGGNAIHKNELHHTAFSGWEGQLIFFLNKRYRLCFISKTVDENRREMYEIMYVCME